MPANPESAASRFIDKTGGSLTNPGIGNEERHASERQESARPTVLVWHEMPCASGHVDWLIGQDREGRLPLITFRLPQRLDGLADGESMAAERIADHRPAYLSYQGPISGNRGQVRRLAEGTIDRWTRDAAGNFEDWTLDIRWNRSESGILMQRVRMTQQGSREWLAISLLSRRVDRQQ